MYQPPWEVMLQSPLEAAGISSIKAVISPYQTSIDIQNISSKERGG
jgi:hypothetical protein